MGLLVSLTPKIPIDFHLTSQCRYTDFRVTKNWILRIFAENRLIFQVFPQNS